MSKVITWTLEDDVPPEVVRHLRKDRQTGPAGLDCDRIENVVACELHKALGDAPTATRPRSGDVDLAALRRIAARSKSTASAPSKAKSSGPTLHGFKLVAPLETVDPTVTPPRRRKSAGKTLAGFPITQEPK